MIQSLYKIETFFLMGITQNEEHICLHEDYIVILKLII